MDEKIISEDQAFALAIAEGEKGAAFVSPNPLVGCVVVDSKNRFLSSGYHVKYGEAHAEIAAVNKLTADQLVEATVYVTLEPCAHIGKTPSCATALAKLPLKKVVYGLRDPNPLVSGKGADILRQAGIEAVEYQGKLKTELEDLCEEFLKNHREKKIFVAAKIASSLDGQIALKSGESRWITGPESREAGHALRARYDALLIGRKTIEVDNPSLNIRHPTIVKQNKLVILDPFSTLVRQVSEGKKYLFLETHYHENIYFAVKNKNPQFSSQQITFNTLRLLHEEIWKLGIRSLMIEGGAQTYSGYMNENLVDRIHLFMAPSIIGAAQGLSWTQNVEVFQLARKKMLLGIKSHRYGQDIYITGKFKT